MLHDGEHEFLVLLLMLQPELDQSAGFGRRPFPGEESEHGLVDVMAIGEDLLQPRAREHAPLRPRVPEAEFAAGFVLARLGKTKEAETRYRRALVLPDSLVRRDVVRIVTPGTVIEEQVLDAHLHNYLAGLCCADGVVGLAMLDLSTGEFWIAQLTAPAALGDALAGPGNEGLGAGLQAVAIEPALPGG